MKILQLNVWMGKIEGNLRRFLEQNDFDLICMQEVMASDDTATHLSRLCFDRDQIISASRLPYSFFSPNWRSRLADGHLMLGNLILSRFPFTSTTTEFTSGSFQDDMILGEKVGNNLNLQIVEFENGLTVVNHHGFWRPNPIGDQETIAAFEHVANLVRPLSGPLVMAGDFNIIHDSPAFRPLDFLRDLTDEYHIETTLSGIKVADPVACDHILVNDQIKIQDFQVLPDLVSDHLAVVAEFEKA